MKNLFILLILLSACSTNSYSNHLGKFNFNYKLINNDLNNIIQVFDDGDKTYLHFFELPKTDPVISAKKDNQKELEPKYYNIRDNFIVLPGTYEFIQIDNKRKISKVIKEKKPIKFSNVKD